MTFRKLAITRPPPKSFSQCVTHFTEKPVAELAYEQWYNYTRALEKVCKVIRLPALEEFPDSIFVEDTCVCIGNKAVITNIGHESRRGEEVEVQKELERNGIKCVKLAAGTLDGGDVLYTGRHLFVGMSLRTNEEGVQALQKAFPDVKVVKISVPGNILHLKCLVTQLMDNHLVVLDNPAGRETFKLIQGASTDYEAVFVPTLINANVLSFPEEKVLLLQNVCKKSNDLILAYLNRLGQGDWNVEYLNMSETIKGDGALTCQSIIIDQQ